MHLPSGQVGCFWLWWTAQSWTVVHLSRSLGSLLGRRLWESIRHGSVLLLTFHTHIQTKTVLGFLSPLSSSVLYSIFPLCRNTHWLCNLKHAHWNQAQWHNVSDKECTEPAVPIHKALTPALETPRSLNSTRMAGMAPAPLRYLELILGVCSRAFLKQSRASNPQSPCCSPSCGCAQNEASLRNILLYREGRGGISSGSLGGRSVGPV